MANHNIEKSAGALADQIRAMGPETMRSMFQLLQVLLDGGPVAPEQAAIRLRISQEEAITLFRRLREAGAEFDEGGNFIGFGLTLAPTSHRYEVHGHTFYTWCAEDAIMFPAIFNHHATIESSDPVTGEPIRLTAAPDGVKQVEPDTAVVSRRFTGGDAGDTRGTYCEFGHLFASRDTASDYLQRHEGLDLEIVSPDEAFMIGRLAMEQVSLLDVS